VNVVIRLVCDKDFILLFKKNLLNKNSISCLLDKVQELVEQHERESEDVPRHWLDYMLLVKRDKQNERSRYFTVNNKNKNKNSVFRFPHSELKAQKR